MNSPIAFVFDLGKVLVDFDFSPCIEMVAAQSNLSTPEVRRLIQTSPLILQYESGHISTGEFFEIVRDQTGFRGTFHQFATFFADVFTPIPEMIRLQSQLKAQGHSTYIFSNTNELAIQHIRHAFPFFSGFNGYILSYEHRAMKPDPRLYQAVEQLTGRSGPAILYLDDLLENVQTGQQRGWQTIHHQSVEMTVQTLKEMGLFPLLHS